MSAYSHARTSSDLNTQVLLGLPEQQAHPPMTPTLPSTPQGRVAGESAPIRWERRMGPNETSYYLPGRGEGVNDMYLHVKLHGPAATFEPARALLVWALLRIRHPLLGSVVEHRSVTDNFFVHELPKTTSEAVLGAKAAASFPSGQTKAELVDAFLNGPRTLSDSLLAKLIVSTPSPSSSSSSSSSPTTRMFLNPANPKGSTEGLVDRDVMLLAGHFLGDGVSFAVVINEFLTLAASDMSDEDLSTLIQAEIDARILAATNPIPVSTEQRLAIPKSWGKFQRAIGQVEFMNNQAKAVGGQTLPRLPPSQAGPRRTHVEVKTFSLAETQTILARCKAQGVTIAHAAFAVVNMAWARAGKKDGDDLPLMIYSAINLRGALRPPKPTASSFFHLCVGYYNVVLPSFTIPSLADKRTFWLRAQSTKAQTVKAVKSRFLVPRAMAMAIVRERQAVAWARIDDAATAAAAKAKEQEQGQAQEDGASTSSGSSSNPVAALADKVAGALHLAPSSSSTSSSSPSSASPSPAAATAPPVPSGPPPAPPAGLGLPKAPQSALMGVSFLGNLDAISNYTTYPLVHSSDLTFGVRQRPGGALMFAYTYAGRLWLSLGWDRSAFEEGKVERLWEGCVQGVEEFLVKG